MNMNFLSSGTPAPPFSMTAAVSNRPISLQNKADFLLLIFHSYQTANIVGDVIQAVREARPHPEDVLIAGVSDMRIVPRFLKGMAEKIIKNAYDEATRRVPAGQDPADHIIILPDWKGAVFTNYQVPDTSEEVALVFIGRTREILGSYMGPHPQKAALRLLD